MPKTKRRETAITIPLGYEVSTGEPVEIPAAHMMVTGLTQRAGKTTTLEALIARSGLRALTFITKRGESAFEDAPRIQPYFREKADWEYVSAIIEATRNEKMRFERGWIVRACRGANSLADVQRNVRKMEADSKRSMDKDQYMLLGEYLNVIVPEISRTKWAATVNLQPGLSVMDLTGISQNLQHLVIQSCLNYVLQHATDVVIVVPEAWKFIPNGRNTPVKLAAESFIRQGAALRLFIWFDSQDIAGVEPLILKSVPVWLLGVQREINEIKRTLAYIPGRAKEKPSAADVAQLGLGQFYASWDDRTVKVYVQPAWMTAAAACWLATHPGAEIPNDMPLLADATLPVARLSAADALAKLRDYQPAPAVVTVYAADEPPAATDYESPTWGAATDQPPADETSEGESMDPELTKALNRLADGQERLAGLLQNTVMATDPRGQPAPAPTNGHASPAAPLADDEEALLARIISRLKSEAEVLRIINAAPEIVVVTTRPVIEIDGRTARGRVATLISEGFMDSMTKITPLYDEMVRRGYADTRLNFSNELKAMMLDGLLWTAVAADKTVMYQRAPGLTVTRKER